MSQVPANNILESFCQTILAWKNSAAGYSYEALCSKPSFESWSLGQLINHIILDTGFHVEQMIAALTDQQNGHRLLKPEAGSMLVQNAFPDVLIEGAAGNAYIQQPASVADLLVSLETIYSDILSLFHTFNFAASKGKSEHPGLGFFTALEWLQFTDMHMRHHFRQKQRIDNFLFAQSISN